MAPPQNHLEDFQKELIEQESSGRTIATNPHYLPQDEVCTSALKLVKDAVAEPILNHSLRVFLIARWLAEKEGSEWASAEKISCLFVAALCHDLGASDLYNGRQRFEVEGADAAKHHCIAHGMSPEDSHRVWTAIAIHTSAGIAERIDSLSRLVRLSVMIDFSASVRTDMQADEFCAQLEQQLPRLNIEKVLGDTVVKQAEKIPNVDNLEWPSSEKFPKASWPGILMRAHLENPQHDGVNPAF